MPISMNRPNMWTFTSVYNVLIYNKLTDIRKKKFGQNVQQTCDCEVIAQVILWETASLQTITHTFEQIVFTLRHIGEGLQITGI